MSSTPLPVFYSIRGGPEIPLPSSGMFGSFGKQANATNTKEAMKKMINSNVKLPEGLKPFDVNSQANRYVVIVQSGGKRRKSRRVRKSRSVKSRRANKTRRFRRN